MEEATLTYLQEGLVDSLQEKKAILTAGVEAAFRAVPRHLFLPGIPIEKAYQDQVIVTRINRGTVISSASQPSIVAMMLEQLQLRSGEHVLEIGAGTGYNAALMAHIVGPRGSVTTLDIDEDIVAEARTSLHTAGYSHVHVLRRDGFFGYPQRAPYDKIILTVSASDLAPAWMEQLREGGCLLLPLNINGPQLSIALRKWGGYYEQDSVVACGFIDLRGTMTEKRSTLIARPQPDLLVLTHNRAFSGDADTIRQWLEQPERRLPFTIALKPSEQHNLHLWLALHESELLTFITQGKFLQRYEQNLLFTNSKRQREKIQGSTLCLMDETGLALLLREPMPEQAFQTGEIPASNIWVAQFGTTDIAAQRLIMHIQTWEKAGRPNEQRLHVQAYPIHSSYQAQMHDLIITRTWTQFVFHWH